MADRQHPESFYAAQREFNSNREFVLEFDLYSQRDEALLPIFITVQMVWPSGVIPGIGRIITFGSEKQIVLTVTRVPKCPFVIYNGGREAVLAAVIAKDIEEMNSPEGLYDFVDAANALAIDPEQTKWFGELVVRSPRLAD